MERNDNIKQHYVPQFYLRNFTDDEGFLHVYDSVNDSEYKVKPSKVAYKEYYHDSNLQLLEDILEIATKKEAFVDDEIRILHEEKIARSIHAVVKLIDEIEKDKTEAVKIEKCFTDDMCEFIILHAVRTSEFRERLKYMVAPFCFKFKIDMGKYGIKEPEILPAIHNLILYGLIKWFDGEFDSLPSRYKDFFEHFIAEQIVMYFQLLESSVLIIKNESDIPFCTTKNPVKINFDMESYTPYKAMIVPIGEGEKAVDLGNNNVIERLFIPLSSEIGIYFFSEKFAREIGYFGKNSRVVEDWNKDIIESLNISMASKDEDPIYSSKSMSDLIRGAKEEKKANFCNLRFR